MKSKELKRCPFCAGEARVIVSHGIFDNTDITEEAFEYERVEAEDCRRCEVYVRCRKCKARVKATSVSWALDLWNTRKVPDIIYEEQQRLLDKYGPYVGTVQLAEEMDCTVHNVYRVLKEGNIVGAFKYGLKWLVPAMEAAAFLVDNGYTGK